MNCPRHTYGLTADWAECSCPTADNDFELVIEQTLTPEQRERVMYDLTHQDELTEVDLDDL